MNLVGTLILSIIWVLNSVAVPLGYYSGDRLMAESLASISSQVKPGMVILIGEKHYNEVAQQGQMEILRAIRKKGLTVSVGMEFISYVSQGPLDLYRQGQMEESDFLNQINWGPNSFNYYREQILFPLASEGGETRAINASRQLTGKVAKTGLQSLTTEEKALLPPQFQLGREVYKKRFIDASHHLPNQQITDNYFAAQSIWDDTMAWQTVQFLSKNPHHVFVIIVGEFHVQYGGGLADRLRARGVNAILSLSQVDHKDYSDEELEKETIPHPEYGSRADFIWIF